MNRLGLEIAPQQLEKSTKKGKYELGSQDAIDLFLDKMRKEEEEKYQERRQQDQRHNDESDDDELNSFELLSDAGVCFRNEPLRYT